MKLFVIAALVAVVCANTIYSEDFSGSWEDRWVKSNGDEGGDLVKTEGGVKTSEDAKFYWYSAKFPSSFDNKGKDLVFQFSAAFPQGIDCGGGYLKLLPESSLADQSSLNGETPYDIMFGPDICGSTKRTHAILTYKGENHLIEKDVETESDKFTHVYTLIIKPDQTFQVLIDNKVKREGNIVDEWKVLPPKEINDPSKSKPEDWVDEAMIDDPEDVKPEGYDDIPAEIPDSDAEKPDDWDEDLDGEWTPPMVSNPDYKGPWSPKRIENPAYKGPWEHPQIPNPEYAEDDSIYHFPSIAGVAIDVWQVKSGTVFGNILLTDDVATAKAAADKVLEKQAVEKAEAEKKAEEERKKAEEEAANAEDDEDEDDEGDEKDEL